MDNQPSDHNPDQPPSPPADPFALSDYQAANHSDQTPDTHQSDHPLVDHQPEQPPTIHQADWPPPQPATPAPPEPAPAPPFTSFEPPVPSLSPMPMASAVAPEMPAANSSAVPQAVVRVLSPRGVEYVFMTIALVTGAIGLSSALISLVNGKSDFEVLAFPAATLLVSVPIFAWLFLRLKKSELLNPDLKLDPSKRRSTQFLQIFSFLISFFTLIGLISIIFDKMAGHYSGSIGKVILDVIVILLVAGGILFYYWRDEHRPV